MLGRYQAYPEYKDSGIDWLGDIPVEWDTGYSKWLFRERNTKASRLDEMLTASQKYGVISQKEFMRLEQQKVVQVQKGHQILKHVESNDFVISMRSFQGGIEYSSIAGAVSSAYVPLEPVRSIHSGYYKFLFKCQPYIQALQSTTNLVRDGQALRYNNFIQVRLPIAPQKDQVQIANFLDHETAKIDTLIEKQQQLIKLLREKRQAVISHAVTKGLNPDIPMKDSGVEWLGEVPAHWKVAKLSYRYEVLLGKMLDDKRITGKFLAPYLRNTDVQWDEINVSDLPEMDFHPDEKERYSVVKGDLLVCEGGEIGRCAIWNDDEPCCYQKALHRLRPLYKNCDAARYMFYALSDAVHQERFVAGAGKATIAHLPAETFRQYRFTYPPYSEQIEISTYLDEQNERFLLLETRAEKQILLLQERRTALISAAVTGKIDVRNWKAPASQNN